jgi:uracil-DNA glycosylase family 4
MTSKDAKTRGGVTGGTAASAARSLQKRIVICRACPRLVEWRERVALEKVRRFRDEDYWGRPVPSFGDVDARLLIVGLAPAAHGGNRTGRIFTGDRSGDWLYRSLYRAGFANQPVSINRSDGLRLKDCYITAVIHCAPPGNKPLREEIANCRGFLTEELRLLNRLRVVVGLGRLAFDAVISALSDAGLIAPKKRPSFAHGIEYADSGLVVIASFHPSQQNTFTGKLTEPMLDRIFTRAAACINRDKRRHRRNQ